VTEWFAVVVKLLLTRSVCGLVCRGKKAAMWVPPRGKIELSEYAISIISFFSDDQRSNKSILSCSSYVSLNFR